MPYRAHGRTVPCATRRPAERRSGACSTSLGCERGRSRSARKASGRTPRFSCDALSKWHVAAGPLKGLCPRRCRAAPSEKLLRPDGRAGTKIYPEGCCLLVDPTAAPWNGCSVVALVDGRNIVIRRYICGNDTVILSSHSFQTASPDLMLNRRRVRVIGVVVWFQASHSIKVQKAL